MSRKVRYNFTGLMAPVFTSFDDTTECGVRTDCIDAYARHLKCLGIDAVLVNGTTGEGPCLSLIERLRTAEHWRAATARYGQSMMLQIGGAPLADVLLMADHAVMQCVDAVLVLPDLFFRPRTEGALVDYCRRVALHCENTPLLYYHIPSQTGVDLNMPLFLDAAESTIPNFSGLKYTSADLAAGAECLYPGRSVFLGADTVLCGALAMGFDSACMTSLNIWPRLAMLQLMAMQPHGSASSNDCYVGYREAQAAQAQLNANVSMALQQSGNWVTDLKAAMYEELRYCGASFEVGKRVRLPRMQ